MFAIIRIKVHKAEGAVVVAACDSELCGKVVKQGKLKLDICESFYGSEDFEEGVLANFLALCGSANLVGGRAVAAAVSAGFVDGECVMVIGGVPHAQFYRV
ncbi:MAG: DUF424 family protein [Methanobacteriota archaeon]